LPCAIAQGNAVEGSHVCRCDLRPSKGYHELAPMCHTDSVSCQEACHAAIVRAATHFNDPTVLLEVSEESDGSDEGAVAVMDKAQMLQTRGW
jgi:hypothetical protein